MSSKMAFKEIKKFCRCFPQIHPSILNQNVSFTLLVSRECSRELNNIHLCSRENSMLSNVCDSKHIMHLGKRHQALTVCLTATRCSKIKSYYTLCEATINRQQCVCVCVHSCVRMSTLACTGQLYLLFNEYVNTFP